MISAGIPFGLPFGAWGYGCSSFWGFTVYTLSPKAGVPYWEPYYQGSIFGILYVRKPPYTLNPNLGCRMESELRELQRYAALAGTKGP